MGSKTFTFPGDVAAFGIQPLKQQITESLGDSRELLLQLDLGSVDYMDSAGLGVLVFAYNRAREQGGKIRIHRPRPRVRELLRMSRMDQVFEIVDQPPDGSSEP